MIAVPAISALILLESRDVLNGFLSQPFVTSLLLIYLGFDPVSMLATASVIHLIYLNRQPSGASLYPEFAFGMFIVAGSGVKQEYTFLTSITIIIAIIFISKISSHILKIKREYFEKHREKLMFYKKFPNVFSAVLFTFAVYFIFSLILYALLSPLLKSIQSINIGLSSIATGYSASAFLCLLLALRYLYYCLRSKNE